MFCAKSVMSKEEMGCVPVYLNVYDLTPINSYAYWLGLGVYHSGVQVYGVEYAFGAHEHASSGIFEGEPKQCEGFTFRKTILIGKTELGPSEVRSIMEDFAEEYKGNAYNLITKNCNHFCNHVCVRLTGNPIPSWVNRLARLGFMCNCVLPVTINSTKVRHHNNNNNNNNNDDDQIEDNGENNKALEEDGEKKKLTCELNVDVVNSPLSSSSSSSPPSTTTHRRGRSRTRRPLPPPSPLIVGSSDS